VGVESQNPGSDDAKNTEIVEAAHRYKIANDAAVHRTIRIYELAMGPHAQMMDLSAEAIAGSDLAFFPYSENGSRVD